MNIMNLVNDKGKEDWKAYQFEQVLTNEELDHERMMNDLFTGGEYIDESCKREIQNDLETLDIWS